MGVPGDGNKYDSRNPIGRFVNEKIEDTLLKTHTIIPAVVHDYSSKTNKVSALPIFNFSLKTGESVSYDPIPDIPVIQVGSKDHACYYSKISAGNTGLLLVSQRSLDEWKGFIDRGEKPVQHAPKTKRRHNISDCLFLPVCFESDVENGIKFNGQLAFENELTDLRTVLETLNDNISTIRTMLTTMHAAIPIAFAASTLAAAGGPAYLGATPKVTTDIIALSAKVFANEQRVRSLLKAKGGVGGLAGQILSGLL